jgi:aryl carrier-like protein
LGSLLQAAKDVPERAQILTGAFIEKIAAVLGVVAETIQPGNPLSMYGLDSIVAVEFRKWFSKTINVDIALFDILSSKSIALLVLKAASLMVIEVAASEKSKGSSEETKGSAAVTEQVVAGEQSSDFDAIALARPANIPMSTFQRRMWYAHNLVEDKSALNICITSHIKGTPDATIFKAALDELKRRNEMLRTAYSEGDDFAEQEPVADFDSRLVYRDLSTEIDVDASLESWRASLQGEELDIENGEIMRPGLFKLGDEKFAFVIAFHHISIDRGSSKALFEQFVEVCNSHQFSITQRANLKIDRSTMLSDLRRIWHLYHLQESLIPISRSGTRTTSAVQDSSPRLSSGSRGWLASSLPLSSFHSPRPLVQTPWTEYAMSSDQPCHFPCYSVSSVYVLVWAQLLSNLFLLLSVLSSTDTPRRKMSLSWSLMVTDLVPISRMFLVSS